MRKFVGTSLVVATFAFTTAAWGQQPAAPTPPPAQYGTPGVTLEQAKKAVEAAEAEAKKNGWLMAIAVVSNGGYLVHFSRMDQTLIRLDPDRAAQGHGGGDVPPSNQVLSGRARGQPGQRLPADPRRRHRVRGRHPDYARRQDHRRDGMQRRQWRAGRASLQSWRGHHQVISEKAHQAMAAAATPRPSRSIAARVADRLAVPTMSRLLACLSLATTSRCCGPRCAACWRSTRGRCATSPPGWRGAARCLGRRSSAWCAGAAGQLSRIAQLDQRTALRTNVCSRRKRTCGPQGGRSGRAVQEVSSILAMRSCITVSGL